MFHYFEVLKPISRTLLNIFRYSKVLVFILKPKTQKRLAAQQRTTLQQISISHICFTYRLFNYKV